MTVLLAGGVLGLVAAGFWLAAWSHAPETGGLPAASPDEAPGLLARVRGKGRRGKVDGRTDVERMRDMLCAASGSCIFTLGPSGRAWFSERWDETFGLPTGDAPSADAWFDRIHPEDLGALVHAMETVRSGEIAQLRRSYRMRCGDEWRSFDLYVCAVDMPEGRTLAGSVRDVTVHHAREARLAHSAFHDPLTGLPNRSLFLDRLTHAAARSRRNPLHRFAVVFVDVDEFKVVNDSLGHPAGDDVLCLVAERLLATARPGDTVARIGGDEFTVLLEPVDSMQDAEAVATRLRESVQGEIQVRGHTVRLSTSVGISFSGGSRLDALDLLRDADTAMYHAKRSGRGEQRPFDRSMHESAMRRLQVESELRRALEGEGLHAHYQPIVDLVDGTLQGFEALARVVTGSGTVIGPGEFVPLAEAQGLIGQVMDRVLDDVLSRLKVWSRTLPKLYVSVNISASSLSPALVERVAARLRHFGVDATRLKLEITESVLVSTSPEAAAAIAAFGELGVGLFIDDFGTGYSSLSYLHAFQAEVIKLDRTFVSAIGGERVPDIVETVLSLSQRIGASVIAEGIETQEQLQVLKGLGCVSGQGYLFTPPVSGDAANRLIDEGRRWPVGAA